jgi:methionyl-tRNA formyltransferase
MRLLFFGTPDFAVPSLQSLHEAGHEILTVVTRPDRPRGRGRKPAPSAVKSAATELGVEVMQPENINDEEQIGRLRRTHAEMGVVVAYGELLVEELLEVPARGFLNLHASLLPQYRGAAPINWALIRGERETGVTVQRMVAQMDAGPVLSRRRVAIGPQDTAGELHDRLAEVGAMELTEVVDRVDRGEEIRERPQDEEEVSYAPKLEKTHGEIKWSLPAEDIKNRVRGLTPWPGAKTVFCGGDRCEEVTLTRVGVRPDEAEQQSPGTIVEVTDDERLVVQTGRGGVVVERLKPANSREMDVADYVHGRRVEAGDRFE